MGKLQLLNTFLQFAKLFSVVVYKELVDEVFRSSPIRSPIRIEEIGQPVNRRKQYASYALFPNMFCIFLSQHSAISLGQFLH